MCWTSSVFVVLIKTVIIKQKSPHIYTGNCDIIINSKPWWIHTIWAMDMLPVMRWEEMDQGHPRRCCGQLNWGHSLRVSGQWWEWSTCWREVSSGVDVSYGWDWSCLDSALWYFRSETGNDFCIWLVHRQFSTIQTWKLFILPMQTGYLYCRNN